MFTISETSGIKTKTKKGFYSGNKKIKKELGIRNSMVVYENKITDTTSNGGLPRHPRYPCFKYITLADGSSIRVRAK
jgi:hypothetical protein